MGQRLGSVVYIVLLMRLGFACSALAPGGVFFCVQPMQALDI